jgi:hypothetical protein
MGRLTSNSRQEISSIIGPVESWIKEATSARGIDSVDLLQPLWKGYGALYRVFLIGGAKGSVVLKHICIPASSRRDRRSSEDVSCNRKIQSYKVELEWYQNWSESCDDTCRVPGFISSRNSDDDMWILLEDLNAEGFPRRTITPSRLEIETCLVWLAEFHAAFFEKTPIGLWETGTYWHLATRQKEWSALCDPLLKSAAGAIDERLKQTFQTIVHGDAKIENFCFSSLGDRAAAVDFQYVGRGCGMKDVAYFISSCMTDNEAEQREDELLNSYFIAVRTSVKKRRVNVDVDELEREWRVCYPIAWADFHRFHKAWSGLAFPLSGYSERISKQVAAVVTGKKV